VYRDKSYFGVEPRGYNVTMRLAVRCHPLGIGTGSGTGDQQEESPDRTGLRRRQAGVRRGPRSGDDGAPGAREDGFRLRVLQPSSAEYLGGGAVAWFSRSSAGEGMNAGGGLVVWGWKGVYGGLWGGFTDVWEESKPGFVGGLRLFHPQPGVDLDLIRENKVNRNPPEKSF
jgi:hypothetical protein